MDEQQRALLTAVAHPVRLEVFDTLQASPRPLSERDVLSVTLGGRVGVRRHLHALEQVGLARLDEDGLWSAVQIPVQLPELHEVAQDDPDRPLVERMHSLLSDRRLARMKQWSLVQRKEGWEAWRASTMANDWTLHMNPAELGALETELMDVVRKHRAAAEEAPAEGREAVFVALFAAPLEALRPRL